MSTLRLFAVVVVVVCVWGGVRSFAQWGQGQDNHSAMINSTNEMSNVNAVKPARPQAKDFMNEITGVTAPPSAIKKSTAFVLNEKRIVKFYMTSWCPYCRKTEQFLKASHIPFEKFDIEKNNKARRDYTNLGGQGVPLLLIDQTVVRGYDPESIQIAWDEWNG